MSEPSPPPAGVADLTQRLADQALLRGRELRAQGQTAAARDAFEEGLRARPSGAALLAEAGWAYAELGAAGEAEQRLLSAWAQPEVPDGVLLGLVHLYLGPLDRPDSVPALLAQARARRPGTKEVLRAELEFALGDSRFDDALAFAAQLREQHPGDPDVALDGARAANEAAYAAHLQGDTEQAVFLLRRALAAAPEWTGLHVNLGQLFVALDRLGPARRHFEEAASLDPHDPLAALCLARLARQRGAPAEAHVHYLQALDLDPDLPEARPELAEVLERLQRPAEAAQQLQAELTREPRCPLCHHNLGVLLARMGQDAGAEQHFREALTLDPEDHRPHYNLAALCANTGRAAAAVHHLGEALRLSPGDCRAWLQRDAATFAVALDAPSIQALLGPAEPPADEEQRS